MTENNGGPTRGLYKEFAQFYTSERCQWAPTSPRRVFNLSFGKTLREYRRNLSDEQVLAAMYATLGHRGADRPGLFQTFDPAKYTGKRRLEDHFVALFVRKLKGKLKMLKRRTTDHGRAGDSVLFHTNPALGLLHERVPRRSSTRPVALNLLLTPSSFCSGRPLTQGQCVKRGA